ncbi:hypothetical protein [Nostoc sp. 106C]|jgi:hypothetical protein|uniref:hypothetical protein n=1 Tax=Nostoc sp. 106C TaxID=1932667 RepID=UPI000A3788E6|nr:hypothetical protein [Nostoc sp. 106C]OUL17674.1 hypothetical protein BV375_35275 [Nostoc sp. 106C]OUL22398.1 hypothetical protein BV378_24885 [Nostoc sp. RF31YmG]
MEDYFIHYQSYKYDEKQAENAIFQAYLYAFCRHAAYVWRLYNSGDICELQASERIFTAWERLKLMQNNKLSRSA